MSVNSNIVCHDSFQHCHSLIRMAHQSNAKSDEKPINLMLLGISGVGKTTLLKSYKEQFAVQHFSETTKIPVLYIALPSRPSESAIYSELLDSMGDPVPFKGAVLERKKRVQYLFNACGVELLIIDEVQHFLDRGKVKTHIAHADALKALIDALGCPIVLAGAPRSIELFRVNTQLRGRFKMRCVIEPFSIFDDSSLENLKKLLRAILSNSIVSNRDFFDNDEFALRIFYATDGVLRNIVDLLDNVERYLLKHKVSKIDLRTLESVFNYWVDGSDLLRESRSGINPNPFKKEYEARRLILPGELYEPSELDGDNHNWKPLSTSKKQNEGAR